MTILCEVCGTENHLEANNCQKCGHLIKKDIEYVICSVCGLSNPQTAIKCVGCSELLDGKSSFKLSDDVSDSDSNEQILSNESSVVVPKTEEKTPKSKKNFKPLFKKIKLVTLALAVMAVLIMLTLFIVGDKVYLEVENAFYYINNTNELHIIDESNDDILIYTGLTEVSEIKKYGNNVYFESDNTLYRYYKNEVVIISETVTSFKVDLTGKNVLYTVGDDMSLTGDLYLFNGSESIRVDAKVGIDRYIFGKNKKDIYYVTDITDEENLGVMNLKRGDDAPLKIADDVFTPLFSMKTNTVYFVRKDLSSELKYELYYANKQRVTEIGRNIQHIMYSYDSEDVLLIQVKNDITSLLWNTRDDVTVFDTEVKYYGVQTFGDVNMPIMLLDDVTLVYQNNDQKNYQMVNQKKALIDHLFSQFWLANDMKTFFFDDDHELMTSTIKSGSLSKIISIATDVSVITLSESGDVAVVKKGEDVVIVKNGIEKILEATDTSIKISNNENYVIYLNGSDSYALKMGAQEPVYLGENIYDTVLIDKYVYTIAGDKLYRYKLGKFSSNKELTTLKTWGMLE